ncbi:MAG: arginine--tRNA ligase, partial [Chloroflexota bacterium]
MKSITEKLSSLFSQAFATSGYDEVYGEVVPSNRPDLSDFQCNGALPAASEYKKNPRQIAQQVVDALDLQLREEVFSEVSLAGPGFINLRLSDRFLAQHVDEMRRDDRLGVPVISRPRKVVLD